MSGRNHKANVKNFLAALAECGIVRDAARAAGVTHGVTATWKRTVPGFPELYEAAKAAGQEKVGPAIKQRMFDLAMNGTVEEVRDKSGNLAWDPIDAEGQLVPPDKPEKIAGYRKATRRVVHMRAIEKVAEAMLPEFATKHQLNVSGQVTHTHDVTDDVKRILADRESTDLANTLARRMSFNAGGNGQSAN